MERNIFYNGDQIINRRSSDGNDGIFRKKSAKFSYGFPFSRTLANIPWWVIVLLLRKFPPMFLLSKSKNNQAGSNIRCSALQPSAEPLRQRFLYDLLIYIYIRIIYLSVSKLFSAAFYKVNAIFVAFIDFYTKNTQFEFAIFLHTS